MQKEFEVVVQDTFKHLRVFMVYMASRTPHIHREVELGLVVDGSVTLRQGKREWTLGKNAMYLINSMDAHEFVAQQPHTLILAVQLSLKLLTPFLPDASLMRFETEPPLAPAFAGHEEDYRTLRDTCVALARDYHGRQSCYELSCFARIGQILEILGRRLPHTYIARGDYDQTKRRVERVARITDFIDQNYQRKLLLDEIAQMNGLTMTYVSHLFRDTLGISFQDYLKEKRFEHAVTLVENSGRTILDISLESGFSDERYLNAAFREHMGCSPREYRKAMRPRNTPPQASENTQHILTGPEALRILAGLYERTGSFCGPGDAQEL